MMPRLTAVALCLVVCSICHAQENTPDNGERDAHSSPEKLFAEFATIYNSGNGDLLPLLSSKAKALSLFAGVYCTLGLGTIEQKKSYSKWRAKWGTVYYEQIEDSKLDWRADYSTIVNPLSKWNRLDDCIRDFVPDDCNRIQAGRGDGARYSTELVGIALEESRAKGSVRLLVNRGVIAGLNGNSLEWIDLDPIAVYFVRIDKKWYICNQAEYNGDYSQKQK